MGTSLARDGIETAARSARAGRSFETGNHQQDAKGSQDELQDQEGADEAANVPQDAKSSPGTGLNIRAQHARQSLQISERSGTLPRPLVARRRPKLGRGPITITRTAAIFCPSFAKDGADHRLGPIGRNARACKELPQAFIVEGAHRCGPKSIPLAARFLVMCALCDHGSHFTGAPRPADTAASRQAPLSITKDRSKVTSWGRVAKLPTRRRAPFWMLGA